MMGRKAVGERDLVGYGASRPAVRWPQGAKLALSLVLGYEEGAESSREDGQGRNDQSGELSSSVPHDRRDLGMEQMFNYGTRAGLWRILDGLAEHGRPMTVLYCGRAAERTPALARHIADLGHEVACHGYRWTNHALFDDEAAERADLARAVAAIEKTVGRRPLGFYSRWGASLATRRLLQEAGFLYDSNAYDDDLPYWDHDLPGGPMLVVPYALDTNDYKFFEGDPWGSPQAFLDYLRAAVEVLLEEGARGRPKMMSLGLHLRIVGRPGRYWALDRFLRHLAGLGSDVWVARRVDIARHWLEAYPPEHRW
jgi:peptidoglycan/xylan/chitin deacetylase (PgdA/CDA1 family)